ncbi:hypothetical protein THIOM_003528 [Candidatus Thiomargarita nelsonii]|uniref:Uncharacterized protein n=1 Tax=Candidatus Thiomargarita nelsonii TaxID=1003181 RepID=A0A176RYG4_9GAMM|nr:hypothetical protein THIOM_003528 [Candidatus Thiomargarita nelsonii]
MASSSCSTCRWINGTHSEIDFMSESIGDFKAGVHHAFGFIHLVFFGIFDIGGKSESTEIKQQASFCYG